MVALPASHAGAAAFTVTAVPVGHSPWAVDALSDQSRVYVANTTSDSVSVIDPSNSSVVATIPVQRSPYLLAAAPDDSQVYVTNADSGTVSVIDTSTNAVTATIVTGGHPMGVAVSDTKVYVADAARNAVLTIDRTANTVDALIQVGTFPYDLVLADSGSALYVGNRSDSSVSVIDTATNTVTTTIPLGTNVYPYGIDATDSRVYVTNLSGLGVSVIDTATRSIVETIPTGMTVDVEISRTEDVGYILGASGGISVFKPSASPITITTYGLSRGYGLAEVGRGVYASNYWDSSVSVVRFAGLAPASQTVTATAGTAITSTQPLVTSGIDGTPTFTVSPALPAGLSLDDETGVISGTPTTAQASTSYTVTASDGTSSTTATVAISVAAVVTPASQVVAATKDAAITSTGPLATTGLTGTVTYQVSPTLPDGLSLNALTGVVSGTPTAAQAASAYTITASNGTFTAPSTLTISVSALAPGTQTVAATHGVAIESTDELTPSGGFDGEVTYSVSPSLPAGLSLDSATGAVSGTPTGRAQEATEYTVTATGAAGGAASASISIAVAAVAPGPVTDVTATPGTGQATVTWTAPTDDGGASPVTYAVTPSTGGAGCVTTETSCVIMGLPTGSTTFEVTASNAAGSSARVTSEAVTIAAPQGPAPQTPADPALAPVIAGTAHEGRTLTARGVTTEGARYQWRADGKAIKGATKSKLRLGKQQAGRRITLTVSVGAVTATSQPTKVVSSMRSRFALSEYTIKRGEGFKIAATGLRSNQRIRVWLGGHRVLIARADGRGVFARTVKFPSSVKPGIRRVRVSGYDRHDDRDYTIRTTVRYR